MPTVEQRKEIQRQFAALSTPQDVAALLGISWEKLRHLLYRMQPHNRYRYFGIPKKSGGKRWITAPIAEIKELQRDMNELLTTL